jgi:hypothetical protein
MRKSRLADVLAVACLVLPAAMAGCGGRLGPAAGDMGDMSDGGALEPAICIDNGVRHALGTGWRCSDGCNSCSCEDGGLISSTTIACVSPPEQGAEPTFNDASVPEIDVACSLLGTWNTHSAPWNGMSTDAVITFDPDGTLTGRPSFTGTYAFAAGQLQVLTTSGPDMNCNFTDTWTVLFSADCATATLDPIDSGCTGARRYLDWSVTLTRP